MPIQDYNGTSNSEIRYLQDYNGTSNSDINYVYDNNGTNDTIIYAREYTLFTVTQQTSTASGAYVEKEKLSSSFATNNASYKFTTLTISGTVGSKVVGQGTYGYEATVSLQGTTNSGTSWTNIKTWNESGNGDKSETASGSYTISSYTHIRVRCWIRTANSGDATGGYAYTTNLSGVIS